MKFPSARVGPTLINNAVAQADVRINSYAHTHTPPTRKYIIVYNRLYIYIYTQHTHTYIYIYMGVVQNTFSRTALNRSANRVATAVPQ